MNSFGKLTPKQKTVLAAIQELLRSNGEEPTLEELRDHLGYSTVSSVQRHVDELKRKNYLDSSKREIVITHKHKVSIPLVGNVACGLPLLAEENIEAYVSYDADKLTGQATDYFFLRAIGDSMNKAGINDGDLVLIQKSDVAEDGQRVVALIGDEATIKKLTKDDGYWILRPESSNPSHKDIFMVDNFSIQGKIHDVVAPL